MRAIHLSNEKKLDAQVVFGAELRPRKVRMELPGGEKKDPVKFLKSTVELELSALLKNYGSLDELADDLIENDPEVDVEIIGRRLQRTRKLYVDQDDRIAYRIQLFQVIRRPDGSEKQRRDINKVPSNINADIPLQWSPKRFPKKEIIRKYVFSHTYQIRHINGVTFDFLYRMAEELQKSGSMVLLGAGAGGTKPILLSRGGQFYRGFLEGRIVEDKYLLLLHLSDIELKQPDTEGATGE